MKHLPFVLESFGGKDALGNRSRCDRQLEEDCTEAQRKALLLYLHLHTHKETSACVCERGYYYYY